MDATVIILIVFIAIILLGLAAFLTIFFIHKATFNKLVKLVERYSILRQTLYNISFYRLDVLVENAMLNQEKFEQLKNNYVTLKDNLHVIYLDLIKLDSIVRDMQLKQAKTLLVSVDTDLTTIENETKVLMDELERSTQYTNGIEDAMQVSVDLFNKIKVFYYTNIVHYQNFKAINELIDLIQKIIDKNDELSNNYTFESIVKIFSDLHKKIKALWQVVKAISILEIIDVYLQTTKQSNQLLMAKFSSKLVYKDKENINKAWNLYEKQYDAFKKAYLGFQLVEAEKNAKLAALQIAQISYFCYVNASSQDLINESIKVINEQTDKLIANKQNILASVNALADYFAKDQKTLNYFNQIEADIAKIENLQADANKLKSATTMEKQIALKQLSTISLNVVSLKDDITNNVNSINYTLQNIISLLTQLNDLYTYNIQMLPTIKILADNDPTKDEFIQIINKNIEIVKQCVSDLITSPSPNFRHISNYVSSMIEDVEKIKEKINSTVILKSYANKLIQYANRYRDEITNSAFEKAEQEYKSKNYSDCIDTLLGICKKFK